MVTSLTQKFSDYDYSGDKILDFIEVYAKSADVSAKDFESYPKITSYEKEDVKQEKPTYFTWRDILNKGLGKGDNYRTYNSLIQTLDPDEATVKNYLVFVNARTDKKYLVKEDQIIARGKASDKTAPVLALDPVAAEAMKKLGVKLDMPELKEITAGNLDTDGDKKVSAKEMRAVFKPDATTTLVLSQKDGEKPDAFARRVETAKTTADPKAYFEIMTAAEFATQKKAPFLTQLKTGTPGYTLYSEYDVATRWSLDEKNWPHYVFNK